MASTWSALKIELLETGQNSGTWGTLTNVNLGDAVLGEAITGSATVDFPTDADVTVTLTDSATSQSARNLRLNITESSTGIGSVRSLILGSGCQIEKFYLINNTGTGAKTVKNTTGTGISVPAGKATLVYNNGTNVVDAATYFTSLTLGTALPVASGGTGLSAGTSGGVPAYTATGTLASSAALTQYGVVYGGGAGAVPVATAAGITGQVLTATTSGAPSWAAPATSGTVTSVAMTVPSVLSISGSPITSSGTLALTYSGTALPVLNGGTGVTTSTGTTNVVLSNSPTLVAPNLGSPSSVGTMPAFTLGGTVSGGGNQINNVIIGTTTPLAGNFTTLTTSSTVTINGGTANGVAYLDASKVLTTGSALTFDGAQIKVTSAPPTLVFNSTVGNSARGLLFENSGTQFARVTANFNNGDFRFVSGETGQSGYFFTWFTDGTEKMRLDSSGNLLVGGTSQSGTANRTAVFSANKFGLSIIDTTAQATGVGGALNLGGNYRTTGDAQAFARVAAVKQNSTDNDYGYGMSFSVTPNGGTFTEAGRFDSSGNLGIGNTTASSFTLNASSNLAVGTGSASAGITIYTGTTNEGAISFADGVAASNVQYRGFINYSHNLDALIFGTAGAPQMRLDSAGNLGLGVTPSAWESTQGSRAIQFTGSAVYGYRDTNLILTQNAYFDGGFKYYASSIAAGYYGIGSGVHSWFNAASGTAGNAISFTQAMTLDASGRLGIGVTNPGVGIVVSYGTDGIIGNYYSSSGTNSRISFSNTSLLNNNVSIGSSSDAMVMYTAATERARIDTSGNLLVGTTSNSTYPSRGYFIGNATYGGLSVSAPGSGAGYPIYFVDSDATSASQQMVHFDRGSSTVGFITTTNTTTSYSSASDYRLKNTIAPITGALAKVALLKPCTYKWNIDGSDGQGFIAHELQEVCPIAVYGTKDAIDADGKPDYQGVDTSFLVATLTAAMQEQQALITQLTARITALETA